MFGGTFGQLRHGAFLKFLLHRSDSKTLERNQPSFLITVAINPDLERHHFEPGSGFWRVASLATSRLTMASIGQAYDNRGFCRFRREACRCRGRYDSAVLSYRALRRGQKRRRHVRSGDRSRPRRGSRDASLIQATFPEHGIIGEEFGSVQSEAEYVWVLDPIDGTKVSSPACRFGGVSSGFCTMDARPMA